jgi:hypothetical protein
MTIAFLISTGYLLNDRQNGLVDAVSADVTPARQVRPNPVHFFIGGQKNALNG